MTRGFQTSLQGQKILVTGASGFIGSRLAARLSESGAVVCALSGSTSGSGWLRRYPEYRGLKRFQFLPCSLTDFAKLKKIVSRFRPLKAVHLGAVVNLERSFETARACVRSNAEGTLNLLEALKGVPFDVLAYLSTVEVYGGGPIPFRESQKEMPPSPYAVSKLAGEQFCRVYSKVEGYPVSVLRLATCYGPGQNEKRLVPSVVRACLAGRPVRLGSGNVRRDFLYLDDALDGILKALVTPAARGRVINLGSRRTVSVREIGESVRKITGSRSRLVYGGVPARKAELAHWSTDSGVARKILGWQARTDLRTGLEKTIDWYRTH